MTSPTRPLARLTPHKQRRRPCQLTRVAGDFGPRPGHSSKQGRLPGVREPHEAHVGDQLEREVQLAGDTGPADVAGVGSAAVPAGRSQHTVSGHVTVTCIDQAYGRSGDVTSGQDRFGQRSERP